MWHHYKAAAARADFKTDSEITGAAGGLSFSGGQSSRLCVGLCRAARPLALLPWPRERCNTDLYSSPSARPRTAFLYATSHKQRMHYAFINLYIFQFSLKFIFIKEVYKFQLPTILKVAARPCSIHVRQQRCFTAQMRDFWRVGIARNAVFFHSFVAWRTPKSARGLAKTAPKNGSCEGSAGQDFNKICTTPPRETGLNIKIVKNWQCLASTLHHACAQDRFGSQNR